jgi:hypothetical protein
MDMVMWRKLESAFWNGYFVVIHRGELDFRPNVDDIYLYTVGRFSIFRVFLAETGDSNARWVGEDAPIRPSAVMPGKS